MKTNCGSSPDENAEVTKMASEPHIMRRSPESLSELITYLEESLDRAEEVDWCVLSLAADESTHRLLSDLKSKMKLATGA